MLACALTTAPIFMRCDAPLHLPYDGIKGVTLTMSYASTAEGEAVFQSLAEGGTVTMPFQPAFWAKRAGMVIDRFGTPWVINGELAI